MVGRSPSCQVARDYRVFFRKAQNRAFSLTELLVIIAIIGILVAIVVPNIVNISNEAAKARNQRNAQTIASLSSAAKTAGATNIFDTANVVPALVSGIATNGLSFSISPLSDSEISGAQTYLTNSTPPGTVIFVPYP